MINTDHESQGKVEQVEPAGKLFKMDMIGINTVEHWIPAHECELVEAQS
jgi:hypothetical protein